ncbi:Smr/MutS family protein [Zymobacter sp. IVIA_5232.4 C2]|uniref:Smr/MutS family protein n=1 Tax=Zymobacter sp. IVIA_5232.4 C2 TaxID=3394855 RepID=UPI0039C2BEA1
MNNDSFDDDLDVFRQALKDIKVQRLDERHTNRADVRATLRAKKEQDEALLARRMAATHTDDTQARSRTSDGRVEPVTPGQSLLFFLPDLPARTISKLKKGEYEWQAGLDLHGYTLEEARQELENFIHDAMTERMRCVLVVHGKAWGGLADYPVIKSHVNAWLRELPEVIAFSSAQPVDGGTGAVYVLLKKGRYNG